MYLKMRTHHDALWMRTHFAKALLTKPRNVCFCNCSLVDLTEALPKRKFVRRNMQRVPQGPALSRCYNACLFEKTEDCADHLAPK
eukprot:1156662-Pelagomonas_calceolata.AAC.5